MRECENQMVEDMPLRVNYELLDFFRVIGDKRLKSCPERRALNVLVLSESKSFGNNTQVKEVLDVHHVKVHNLKSYDLTHLCPKLFLIWNK